LLANIRQSQAVPQLAIRRDDVGIAVLPLFHIYGLNVVLGLALHAGASVVVVDHFDAAATLGVVRDRGVTVLSGVPAMFRAWAEVPPDAAAASACALVRLAVSGAAALDAQTVDAFRARFGVQIYEGYGLTEASPVVTTTAVDRAVRPDSIGPPLPGVEVRLVDEDGSDALVGDPGEIWVRGPNVFAGYWHDAEATARVLDAQGWLHTGDVAVADGDGWLTLVDRTKDMINVSGFKVYPAEVEEALREYPGVADAAVVGERDAASRTEQVVAFVVARDAADPPTPTQLVAHLRARLARYKIPTRYELVAEVPRSDAGKLLRRALPTLAPDATAKPA
jgi:long-chain acyl-CoA synthetase